MQYQVGNMRKSGNHVTRRKLPEKREDFRNFNNPRRWGLLRSWSVGLLVKG